MTANHFLYQQFLDKILLFKQAQRIGCFFNDLESW
jgi:hypothetical protein